MRNFLSFILVLSLVVFPPQAHAGNAGKIIFGAAVTSGVVYLATAGKNTDFAKKMKEQCSANYVACAIAVVAAAQAVIMIAGYFDSKKTSNASQCQGDLCNSGGGTETNNGTNTTINPYTYTPGDPNDPANITLREAQTVLKDMRSNGYTIDTKTGSVKTPKGTMSPEQIAAAGNSLSSEDKAALGIDATDSNPANATASANFEGSSETGGGKRSGGSGGEGSNAGFDMNGYLKKLMGAGDGNRGVAGLSVKAGNDNVGVRESNIFEQASRAYTNDKTLNRGP